MAVKAYEVYGEVIIETTSADNSLKKTDKAVDNLRDRLKIAGHQAQLFGSQTDVLKEKQKVLKEEIQKLINNGVNPADERIKKLKTEYNNLDKEIQKNTITVDKNKEQYEKFTKKLNEVGSKMQTLGKNMTKYLTLPILAIGTASVKMASDLGESLNAVDVVFGDVVSTINDFGEIAADSAGLSQRSFNDLATVTGTLLKTTGQSMDQVANSTIELTKRAADVASVFNVDVSEAMTAFNAALRGESEPSRRFGVLLSENSVQAEIMASGIDKLTSLTEDQMKVQARYNIIMRDTNQTQGDFVNTSDSLANSLRITKANLENAAAKIGEKLLPIVTKIVEKIADFVDKLGNLNDEQIETIIKIGGLVAAIGPVISIAGKAVSAISALRTGITALGAAAGPVGLILTAIAAATGAAIALDAAVRKNDIYRQTKGLAEQMKEIKRETGETVDFILEFADKTGISIKNSIELADEQGLITDELRDQLDILKEQENYSSGRDKDEELKIIRQLDKEFSRLEDRFGEIRDEQGNLIYNAQQDLVSLNGYIGQIADKYNLTNREVLAFAQNHEFVKESAQLAFGALTANLEVAANAVDGLAIAEARLEEKRAQQAAARDARDAERRARQEEQAQVLSDRTQLWNDYNDAVADAQTRENLGIISNIENLEMQKDALDEYIEKLYETGYRGQADYDRLIAKSQDLQAQIDAEIQKIQDKEAAEKEAIKMVKADELKRNEELKSAYESYLSLKASGEEMVKQWEEDEKERLEGLKILYQQIGDSIATGFISILNAVNTAQQNNYENQIKRIQDEAEAGVKTEEQAQAEIEAIRKESAKKEWELTGLRILAESALAITKAIGSAPFPFNLPAIIATTAATVAQGVVWASAKPFEQGGVVPGTSYTGDKILARVNSGEMILNQAQQQNLFDMLDRPALSYTTNNNYAAESQNLSLSVGNEVIYKMVNDGIANRKIRVAR